MQTFLCSLIVLFAALYVANRWLPAGLKRRLFQMAGKTMTRQSSGAGSACSSCSSCGNCAEKVDAAKKIIILRSK